MKDIFYYNPSPDRDVIGRLLDLIRSERGSAIDAEKSASPGAYVISACFYSVPDYAVRELREIEGYHERTGAAGMLSGAESRAADKKYWIEAGGAGRPEDYFSAAGESGGINTFQFLCNCCVFLAGGRGGDVPVFLETGVNFLMNRFERFGRIYTCYDGRFTPAGEDFGFLYNYPLLSVSLSKMFEMGKGLRYLNAALKVNDIFPHLSEHIRSAGAAMAALAAIFLGDRLLGEFYEDRKFRLPAD